MSDFLDNQAQESEGEDSDNSVNSDNDEPKAKRQKKQNESKKKNRKKVLESSDDDEDEDDDEAQAREEMKGFIADEEEEEGEEEGVDDKSEKSKEDDELDELDDDDMDLIQENLDIKRKNVKRVQMDDSDEDEDDRSRIQKKLFDDNGEGGEAESDGERSERRDYDDHQYSDSEQSEDNFIVPEDGERGGHRKRPHSRMKNVPEGALDEARDIFGVEDFDIEDFYNEEEEAMDDEEDEVLDEDGERVRKPRRQEVKSSLLDQMEPSDLERGFLAPADKKIQLEDVPERFQLRRTQVKDADEYELDTEARWICQHGFWQQPLTHQKEGDWSVTHLFDQCDATQKSQKESDFVEVVKAALQFIRKQQFEVPFIAMYRKEIMRDFLKMGQLWRVYDFDEKFCHVHARKEKLIELMKRMQTYQVEGDMEHRRQLSEIDLHDAHCVDTATALADVMAQFQMYYGNEVAKMQEWEKNRLSDDDAMLSTRFKSCTRTDKYQLCAECGIGDMAKLFGLTPRQFAENLDWKKHDVEQDEREPDVAAEDFISSSFPSPDDVIAGSVYMVAREISRQPLVRNRIRHLYRRRVTFTARVTQKGREQIDDSHALWEGRYIREKPINELKDDLYLHYDVAKQAGLIDYRLVCDTDGDKSSKRCLVDEILQEQPFRKDEFSDVVEKWNDLREQAVRMAIDEMLIPYLEQELHQNLLEEARAHVIQSCREELRRRIDVAAFKPTEEQMEDDDEEFNRLGEIRVMAISYVGDFGEAAFGALVDQDGAVVDYCRMMHLTRRANTDDQRRLKGESMAVFKRFVLRKRPHIIALAAESQDALRLKQDLQNAIHDLKQDDECDLNMAPRVVLIGNDVGKVYQSCRTASMEHPDYPPTLRQAISLARVMLDPLLEYAHLFNHEEDFLCLTLHPLQSQINKDDLSLNLAQEMVGRVNLVGVDVNRCLEHNHLSNLLQFVAGLGPRKAAHILKTLKQHDNLLESRTSLVTVCKMGPKVFMNCAGFIKIDTTKVSEKTDAYVEVLDGSRVHPETYEWARKMAVDALEYDDNADPTSALEEILQMPEKLKDLDLDAFAEELKRQGFGEKKDTLYDIAAELNHRYHDQRASFSEPSDTDIYNLVASDIAKTLKPGKIVRAVLDCVQYKKLEEQDRELPNVARSTRHEMFPCPYCQERFADSTFVYEHVQNREPRNGGCRGKPVGLRMKLNGGIGGFIPSKLVSDQMDFATPAERVHPGIPIWCKVLKVDPERFSCLLTCRASDLNRKEEFDRDPYWDDYAEQRDNDKEKEQVEKKMTVPSTVIKRVIAHPFFANISFREAEILLNSRELGDAIIRPGSKSDHLTVTWKVAVGVMQNIDVEEREKDQPFALGKKLIIGDEEFEDLDEIIARHVNVLAGYAREVMQHKNFALEIFGEEKEKIDMRLGEEKAKNPKGIPYMLSPSKAFQGRFVLSYQYRPGKTINEYLSLRPVGFKFRGMIFPSLNTLMTWFKTHFRDPPPNVAYGRR